MHQIEVYSICFVFLLIQADVSEQDVQVDQVRNSQKLEKDRYLSDERKLKTHTESLVEKIYEANQLSEHQHLFLFEEQILSICQQKLNNNEYYSQVFVLGDE
jgi:hypothetical protein